MEVIDANKQTFTPQSLMADRDVEKEKLIRSNQFKDMLMAEWEGKTKEKNKLVRNLIKEELNMKENYTNKNTEISYTLKGDYYVPNLVLEQEKKITYELDKKSS